MSMQIYLTDKTLTDELSKTNLFNLTINSGANGVIDIVPGAIGYNPGVAPEFGIKSIQVAPALKAYTLRVEGSVDGGSTWFKIIDDIVRTGAETSILLQIFDENLIFQYPIKITIITASGPDETYSFFIPLREVGGSDL